MFKVATKATNATTATNASKKNKSPKKTNRRTDSCSKKNYGPVTHCSPDGCSKISTFLTKSKNPEDSNGPKAPRLRPNKKFQKNVFGNFF